MSDFEKELAEMTQKLGDEPEKKLPSVEEQKAIAEKLKKLEAEGALTPEILEEYFGKFNEKSNVPIH